ncbi:hypothetical protein WN943_025719 [Citrus x changshan-huyou]
MAWACFVLLIVGSIESGPQLNVSEREGAFSSLSVLELMPTRLHCSALRLMEESVVHPVKYNDEGKPTVAEFEYPKIYHNDAVAMEDYKFLNSSHVATASATTSVLICRGFTFRTTLR